jgi:exodeoxyribonuclease III
MGLISASETAFKTEDDTSKGRMSSSTALRVMAHNTLGAGGNEDNLVEETVSVIQAARADNIVGLQETRLGDEICSAEECPPRGHQAAGAIADALGYYYYYYQSVNSTNVAMWANAVICRYPIVSATTNDLGVAIDVIGEGQLLYLFNILWTEFPYRPYKTLGIPFGDAPFLSIEYDLITATESARGQALELLFAEMTKIEKSTLTVLASFVTGDLIIMNPAFMIGTMKL